MNRILFAKKNINEIYLLNILVIFYICFMDSTINLKIKLQVLSRYLGQQVWLENLYGNDDGFKHRIGILTGVKADAVQIRIGEVQQWITLHDSLKYYEIRLLLKPLSRLTDSIKETANSLPVTVFITQYYIQMGFDMPVFISPGHPLNCKYAAELGFADYRLPEEIIALNDSMQLAYY